MKLRTSLLLASLLGVASLNATACYTVYDHNSRVIYQGEATPVDMSLQFHQTLGRRFPGSHMVFDQYADCRPVSLPQVALAAPVAVPAAAVNTAVMGAGPAPALVRTSTRAAAAPGTAPVLTDRRTAMAANVPFTVLSGDIVVVPAHFANRVVAPSVNVVPPAVPTRISSAAPQVIRNSNNMITALRDPAMRIEQRRERVVVSQY